MMFIGTMDHKTSDNDDFIILYMIVYIDGHCWIRDGLTKQRMPKTKDKVPLVHWIIEKLGGTIENLLS